MPRRRTAIRTLLAAAATFGLVTLVALEGGDMAVLVTRQADGSERRTRVWFAEDEGALWVEAATTSRPFYRDLQRQPLLTVELRSGSLFHGSTSLRARAETVGEPGGHERIRRLLADKYGWADQWVALLQDTSASRALRLVSVELHPDATVEGRQD